MKLLFSGVLGLLSIVCGFAGTTPTPMVSLPSGYQLLMQDAFTEQNWNQTQVAAYGHPMVAPQRWYANQPNNQYNYAPNIPGAYVANPPGTFGYPFANKTPNNNSTHFVSLGNWKDTSGNPVASFLSSVDQSYHGTLGAGVLPHPGAVRHGYFEAKFLLPTPKPGPNGSTSGLWPAFWLQPLGSSPDGLVPEMDIFEGYSGDNFASLHTTWHLWNTSPHQTLGFAFDSTGKGCECLGWTPVAGTPPFCAGWHTIGVLIDSQNIHLYLDKKAIWTTPNPDDQAFGMPMFVDLQAALGGYQPFDLSWSVPGYPGTNGPGGYFLKFAYVCVWGDPTKQ